MPKSFPAKGSSGVFRSFVREGLAAEQQTSKQAAAAMLRNTEDPRMVVERSMADAVHFDWLKHHLLVLPPQSTVFDIGKPLESYARLFNDIAFPVGRKDRLAHALVEAGRDVQVIPGVENGRKRWKLQCLAVSSPWLDPLFEVPFPRLNEGLGMVESLIGSQGAAFAEVQMVTFAEWNGRRNAQQIAMGNRMERLGEKIAKVGATFEVITWDCTRFDWSPQLDRNGQPIMKRFISPCHWRLDRWSRDGKEGRKSTRKEG